MKTAWQMKTVVSMGWLLVACVVGIVTSTSSLPSTGKSTLAKLQSQDAFATLMKMTPFYGVGEMDADENVVSEKEGACKYDYHTYHCVISTRKLTQILFYSKNHLAKIYASFLWANHDSNKMSALQQMSVNRHIPSIREAIEKYTFSPCYGNASSLLKLENQEADCGTYANQRKCAKHKECSWSSVSKQCTLNAWYMLYNIPTTDNVPQGLHEVLEHNSQLVIKAYETEMQAEIRDLHWKEFRELETPAFECPDGVAETVCLYAKPFTKLFPQSFYCTLKYHDIMKTHLCHNDPVCETVIGPEQTKCTIKDRYLDEAKTEAQRVFRENIKDPFLHDLFEVSTHCGSIGSANQCKGNICHYNRETFKCMVSQLWIVNRLANEDAKDILCKVFNLQKSSKCGKSNSDYMCKGNCEWNHMQDICEASVEYYIGKITKNDPDLREEIRTVKSMCAKRPPRQCDKDVAVQK